MGTQGTAQADTRLMWTFVIPKAPSRLCFSHQSSVYPLSHQAFICRPLSPPPICLTAHQLATQTGNNTRSPETTAMLVGQEDSRESLGKAGRRPPVRNQVLLGC